MSHEDQTPYTTRGAWPAPDEEPTVATSAPAASLPRADAPMPSAAADVVTLRRRSGTNDEWYLYIGGVCVQKMEDTPPAQARERLTELQAAIARHLDAYAAAALTQEQRDVLTLFEYAKGGGNVELWTDHAGLNVALNEGRNAEWKAGPDALHAAAAWVRAQGANESLPLLRMV